MEELMKKTKAGQSAPASETEPKKKFGLPKSKKAKKWMKIAIAAVVRMVTTEAFPVIATHPTDSP